MSLLHALETSAEDGSDVMAVLRRYPKSDGTYAKSQLLSAYRSFVVTGELQSSLKLERLLRGRPVRTISGVAPVAVLTEPYTCPGECLFCPNDSTAPKSYLDGEPGVLRAIQNAYDPYAQTHARLTSLKAIGHPLDKVELLVLGGTWSAYPRAYREWFLKRCFDAINMQEAPDLATALRMNEKAQNRNVGLVIETRPDCITPDELLELRRHGVTKVQLGAQSFNDRVLKLNKRGHTLAGTRHAIRLLRLAGYKIVLHWMPNLYGSTPEDDLVDFGRMWDDPALRPDELKIYPTALVENTELYDLWTAGKYAPYPEQTLIDLLVSCKQLVPPYCRINRLMRDIPAQLIVAGTTRSNLRQIVQRTMHKNGQYCQCIRCREIRKAELDMAQLEQKITSYVTDATQEHFIQYVTPKSKIVAFLRLSLPLKLRDEIGIEEIRESAMIREVHVYGPAQSLGAREDGIQHQGLGTLLLDKAAELARDAGYTNLSVISAVGTRPYYRERGFVWGDLYPTRSL
ncbi:MAG: tRNA uridine(34) 5-carboxymethylaminomethyl modification radical SAM/GNAT enzyme Elp3 [Anaerolineae bacterium]|nr:tRNA uridine(34) 5-carboxymethylaminomethyl modification radical SAM/GNAT enzyme Elp3 [Anaerolineae bacterium]